MKRKRIVREVRLEWEVDESEMEVLRKYLGGSLSSREAGELLGISHQQVINVIAALAQQWFQDGKLKV